MKNFSIKLVWFTTLFFIVFVGLCQTNINPSTLLIIFIVGQILVLFMVYKVLKDQYSSTKTFKDWYEDHRIDILED